MLAVLGVADTDLLFSALDAIAARDAREALLGAARLVDTGRDPTTFVKDLEAHARDLMVVQALGELPAELRLTPDRDARLVDQASRIGRGEVARLLDLLAAALEAGRNGADPRTQLELALVKAASPEVDPSVKALLARVEALEGGRPQIAPPPLAPPRRRSHRRPRRSRRRSPRADAATLRPSPSPSRGRRRPRRSTACATSGPPSSTTSRPRTSSARASSPSRGRWSCAAAS